MRIPGVFTLSRIPMIDRLSPVSKNLIDFHKVLTRILHFQLPTQLT